MIKRPSNSLLKIKNLNLAWPLVVFLLLGLIQSPLINKASVLLFVCYLFTLHYKEIMTIGVQSIKAYGLLLFLLWDVLSLTWTVTPSISFIYVINDLEILLFSIMVAYHARDMDVGNSLKLVAMLVIASAAGYCVIFPGESMSPSGFTSFYGQKNNLGFTMALCSMIIALMFKNNFTNYFFITTGLSLLVFSQSKTSMFLFVFILFLVGFLYFLRAVYQRFSPYTQGFFQLIMKTIPFVFYVLIVLLVIFSESIADYFIATFPYDALTGRGVLWVTVLTRTRDDLLVGIGPGAFWNAEESSEILQTALPYEQAWVGELTAADGGYVDLIGSLGFIGLGLLLFAIVQAYVLTFKNASMHTRVLSFSLITFFVLHCITETDILRFTNSLWFIFVFFTFYLAFKLAKDRSAQASRTNTIATNK